MVDPGNYQKPATVKVKPPQEGLPDYFIFYLERDILGKICNLHTALCDQLGRDGPKHPDSLTLAHLQSIAVDFAKHGEPVDPRCIERIEKMVEEWPDFFEKDHKEMRPSDGILGQMYRDISNEQAMEELLIQDHRAAIKLDYALDDRILGQVKDTGAMLSYLPEAYQEIVKPMT